MVKLENFPFIDCHLHFHSPEMTDDLIIEFIQDEFPHILSFYEKPNDNSVLLGMMDAINCERGWIINYESAVMGYTLETNDWVAKFCEESNNRLVPFGGINPLIHDNAGEIMAEYFETGKLRGLKVHGPHQQLHANAYIDGLESQGGLYAMCQELDIPVMFHTGSSIFPGSRSKFGNPLDLEDILIDFPDLRLIMSHGGRPFWLREAEYLMIKYQKNLYLDLAGVPPSLIPTYFPRFHRFADRAMYGSDYPSPGVPSPRENADNIANFPLSEEIKEKIFRSNALYLIDR